MRILRDEKNFENEREIRPKKLECNFKEQEQWENGVLILETMKELISRFPSKKVSVNSVNEMSKKKDKQGDNQCQMWDNFDQPVQLQVCRKQDNTVNCPSLLDLIKQACRGNMDPSFGRIKNYSQENSFNKTYKVATIIDQPFVFKDYDGNGNVKWTGFSMDLLNRMAKEIGFQYEITEYKDYGSFLPDANGTKRWTGLVGAVERGDADFAVSAMTVTPQRY